MEKIINSPFHGLNLPNNAEIEVNDKTLLITKWNWDIKDCLTFQKEAQQFIAKNRSLKVYIFCNHPHVFTVGRGNERGETKLVEFDFDQSDKLPFKVFKIHRGGGITFHHPGQWIFYPIRAIKESYTLDDHMCWLLKSVASVLRDEFELENVVTAKKLMGVWCDRKKLASIGVGVNRFVTEQGLALNLSFDDQAIKGLNAISPCGMSAETYQDVSSLVDLEKTAQLLGSFHKTYLKTILT